MSRVGFLLALSFPFFTAAPAVAQFHWGQDPGRQETDHNETEDEWTCEPNIGRGLLRIADAQPFASFHLNLPTTTPRVLAPDRSEFSAFLDWGNTFAQLTSQTYLVDTELFMLRLNYERGVCENWQIGVELPIVHRDGGTMDGFIQGFHGIFGLSQGGRKAFPENAYSNTITTGSGTRTIARGTGVGDLSLWTKYMFTDENSWAAAALVVGMKLPTASHDFGSGGVDLGASLNASKDLCDFATAYAGIGPKWYSDTKSGSLRFHAVNWDAYAGVEFAVIPDVSLTAQMLFESPLLTAPSNFNDGRYYYAIGFIVTPWDDRRVFEIGAVNNISNYESTADFTWHFGFTVPF